MEVNLQPAERRISQGQKALDILRVLAQTAAEGKSLTIANDWGFGTATVINQDGAHTHVGADYLESEQRNFEVFVDQLHALLVESRGLSWVDPSIPTKQKADELLRRKGSACSLHQDALSNPCEGECPACVGCKTMEATTLSVENQILREENIRLRTERATRLADSERVIDWIRNGTKPAVTSFTEGAERQIAYAVEDDRLRRNRANQ